jgi:hypothetical protein
MQGPEAANGVVLPQASPEAPILDVPFLIVGADPAGASLACYLGKFGKNFFTPEGQLGRNWKPSLYAFKCFRG